MRISGILRSTDIPAASQELVVKEEPLAFNVLKGEIDKPFLSCTFSDLLDIRAHFEFASRQFRSILIYIEKPLDHAVLSNLLLVIGQANSISIDIPETFLFKNYRELFALLVPEEELRYLCLKGKKVGDRDWHSA